MAGYHSRFLRVYLLDDHDIVRRGLRDLLAPATDIYVAGESGSARTAAREIPELAVDVMLLDLRLPDGSGVEVCRAVRALSPDVRGLLLTSSDEDEALAASILAGAAGYIVKLTSSSDIATAIRRVGAGQSLVDAGTLDRARQRLIADLVPLSSGEELELLTDVVQGRTDAEIAARTGRSLADVAALVTGLLGELIGPPLTGDNTSQGRHRRED